MPSLDTLRLATLALIGAGIFTIVLVLALVPPLERPTLGRRGVKRAEAVRDGIFALLDPAVRQVAAWIRFLPLRERRERIHLQLVHAGEWLGVDADEYFALCVLSSIGLGLLGIVLGEVTELGFAFVVFFAGIGAMLPYSQVTGEIQERFKQCNRQLPGAIDLAALCMGAGLDFPGALRQIVEKTPARNNALHEEITLILQELEFGRTRRQALENFALRVPTEAIRDFVGTVVQAEEKGNPLAEVLRIQAQMLRMRRSVAAEEAAAKAGVMMMFPLMLIFCAIILILLGPFILNGMNSGF